MPEKSKPKRQNAERPELISYYVSAQGGDFIVQIAADWKVTFGAVNPGAAMGRGDLHCVRVWEGEKLRAVFCNVRAFRDLSIPLVRKITKETGNTEWTADSDGSFERNERVLVEATYEPEPGDIPF